MYTVIFDSFRMKFFENRTTSKLFKKRKSKNTKFSKEGQYESLHFFTKNSMNCILLYSENF